MAATRLITIRLLASGMWLLSMASLVAWFLCSQALDSFVERCMRLGSRLAGAGT